MLLCGHCAQPRLLAARSFEKCLRAGDDLRLARICPYPNRPLGSLDEHPANDSNISSCPSALFASQIGNGSLNSPVGLIRVDRSQLSFGTFGSPYAACVVIAGSAPKESGNAMIVEVQTGVACRGCNDSERLNAERRQIRAISTEASYRASAKRAVHPPKQTEEHWASTKVIT